MLQSHLDCFIIKPFGSVKLNLQKFCHRPKFCMLYKRALIHRTFMIIHSSITMLMQQLLHAAECDGGKVTRVFELQEALQIGCCLTPSHIHALAVHRIQPWIKTIMKIMT